MEDKAGDGYSLTPVEIVKVYSERNWQSFMVWVHGRWVMFVNQYFQNHKEPVPPYKKSPA